MRISLTLLFAIVLLNTGCSKDETPAGPAVIYDAPTWNQLVTTPNTGTPQEKLDRFVAANNLDTIETKSGLVYIIERQGTGNYPTIDSTVTAWYKGYFVDGRVFDSTDGSTLPRSFPLNSVIEGWKEGIPLIQEGGKIWLIIRPRLGYGSTGRPSAGITGDDILVFEVELLEAGI